MSAAVHHQPHEIPHVFDASRAEGDARALNQALSKFFTDGEGVFNIMCRRTVRQIKDIQAAYEKIFHKSLMDACKENSSGHFEDLLIGLNMDPCEYDAYRIRKATKGLGTDEDQLIEICAHRTVNEIQAINSFYERDYSKSALQAVQSDVSGDLGNILSLLINPANARLEPTPEHLESQLKQDCDSLFKASQDKLVGHDVLPFINVLGNHNKKYIQKLYGHYANKHGKSIDGIIASWALGGATARTLLAISTPPEEFYADLLYKAMKGVGTNDDQLIRIIIEQRERYLAKIAEFFLHKYKKTLRQWVKEETSGKYGDALLTLLDFYASVPQ